MRIVFFVHSIVSDWNNGHAHFLRGLAAALNERGHEVVFCEPRGNWSTDNLFKTAKAEPIVEFARRFPWIDARFYRPAEDLIEQVDALTTGADVVVVHEFNEPEAMACGIPLVTTYWRDTEGLFTAGKDYLMAESPEQMRQFIRRLLESPDARQELASHALDTIRRRHHCGLRAEQLEDICESMMRRAGPS